MNLVPGAVRAWLISLLFLLLLTSDATAQPPDQTDNQQWTEIHLTVPVTRTIDFNIIGGVRFGRDISHTTDERIGVGFTFRAGKYVTIAPHYLHIGMQPFAGSRIWENRVIVPVTFRFNVGKFRLSDRNQFERRMRNSGAKTNRYRNRFVVEHPIGPDKLGLAAFVTDEVFYDWAVDRWTRNRFGVGVTKVFNKHFSQDFYYLRQNDSFSTPGDLNVIGTILRFKL